MPQDKKKSLRNNQWLILVIWFDYYNADQSTTSHSLRSQRMIKEWCGTRRGVLGSRIHNKSQSFRVIFPRCGWPSHFLERTTEFRVVLFRHNIASFLCLGQCRLCQDSLLCFSGDRVLGCYRSVTFLLQCFHLVIVMGSPVLLSLLPVFDGSWWAQLWPDTNSRCVWVKSNCPWRLVYTGGQGYSPSSNCIYREKINDRTSHQTTLSAAFFPTQISQSLMLNPVIFLWAVSFILEAVG